MSVQFCSESTRIFDVTPRHNNEEDEAYDSRLFEAYRYRRVPEACKWFLPFDHDEIAGLNEGCLFDRAFRSSFVTTFYNMNIRCNSKLISDAERQAFASLVLAFKDGLQILSSGINKESLYLEVKAMAETIESQIRLFHPSQRGPVYEAQDPISRLTLDRLQELRNIFLTVHYPILGLGK